LAPLLTAFVHFPCRQLETSPAHHLRGPEEVVPPFFRLGVAPRRESVVRGSDGLFRVGRRRLAGAPDDVVNVRRVAGVNGCLGQDGLFPDDQRVGAPELPRNTFQRRLHRLSSALAAEVGNWLILKSNQLAVPTSVP